MDRRTLLQMIPAVVAAAALTAEGAMNAFQATKKTTDEPPGESPVFELRIYHAAEGRLDDLVARFRDHTMALFERHGLKNVAYWLPIEDPLKGKTLFYILEHPSREAATKNWKAFQDDPEWQKVKAASEANGKLVEKIDSTFMALTDFSPKVG
jgi:hypothetical protein